jgi:hypothetical protein
MRCIRILKAQRWGSPSWRQSNSGSLRKLRQADPHRGKGKRGGLRVIYYWWLGGDQFWLFTVYDNYQVDDLTPPQRKVLKQLLKTELENCQLKYA